MLKSQNNPLAHVETTCGVLLYELQIIWDEIGENDVDRDRMLLELEQECLEVYRRKVDQANRSRAKLRQAIADSEAELAAIRSALGEIPLHIKQSDLNGANLKEELKKVIPHLEEMRKKKSDRKIQFLEVLEQIQGIATELSITSPKLVLDESDLTLRKLEELHTQLHALQAEKSNRLNQVHDHLVTLNSLCSVLGLDFRQIVSEIHFSLGDSERQDISTTTIDKLAVTIKNLREVKLQRMEMLQDLATTMLELWNLMDTPIEEQQRFQNVTCNVAASENEITEPDTLSMDFITCVQAEVNRLEEFKASKMKELVLKKRGELDEICRKTHLILNGDSEIEQAVEAMESGAIDPACLLEQIELQIAKVKEESFSRKELLEKVEKWLSACEEESWLEEYNRDDNRYNAGRGAHLTLKRAERARALVNKLPAMVDALVSKTLAWEKERGTEFIYDGMRLLTMLHDYTLLQQEKDQERRRLRDQKKLQGQLIAEQEALYGSKPSPSKTQLIKKAPRTSTGGGAAINRRLSLGGAMIQTPKPIHSSKSRPISRKGIDASKNHSYEPESPMIRQPFSPITTNAVPNRTNLTNLMDDAAPRNHSYDPVNAREPESPMIRQPFSPITTNAVPNRTNLMDDAAPRKGGESVLKKVVQTSLSTPSKTTTTTTNRSLIDEENRTPNTMPPATPSSTMSIPMQTALTPYVGASAVKVVLDEEIEYSFEERRAGFALPNMIQI